MSEAYKTDHRKVVGYLIHPEAHVDVFKNKFMLRENVYIKDGEMAKACYHVKKTIRIDNFSVHSMLGSEYLMGNFRGRGIVCEIKEQCSEKTVEPVVVNFAFGDREEWKKERM